MTKKLCFLILPVLLILLFACTAPSSDPISEDDAIAAVLDKAPDATDMSCLLSEDGENYLVTYKSVFGRFTASVDAESGNVTSIRLLDDPEPLSSAPVDKAAVISAAEALSVVKIDADLSGDVNVIENEYDAEAVTFSIILRSGNKEYAYTVDAKTGDILSKQVDIDF